MKAIFIAYNQAYGNEIVELLEGFGQRGFTSGLTSKAGEGLMESLTTVTMRGLSRTTPS